MLYGFADGKPIRWRGVAEPVRRIRRLAPACVRGEWLTTQGTKTMKNLHTSRTAFLLLGLVLGLIAGLNFQGVWPAHVPLHATATQGQENYAIATGLVDNDVEAIYFLDFLTGDLQARVINPRTGEFNARFRYNIANDFGQAQGRNPKYLMVTGLANMPRGRSNSQFAQSIVYISDASTGQTAAYTIPWNQGIQSAGGAQENSFRPIAQWNFRTVPIRDLDE